MLEEEYVESDVVDPEFFKNQEADQLDLFHLKISGMFDSLQKISQIGVNIANHHGKKGETLTRFEKEIEKLGFEDALDNFICRVTALQTSEVSETLEEARLPNRSFKHLLEEQTDVLLRTLNAMNTILKTAKEHGKIDEGLEIGDFVHAKMIKNTQRPRTHGKRF